MSRPTEVHLEGEELWRTQLGGYVNKYANALTPTFRESLILKKFGVVLTAEKETGGQHRIAANVVLDPEGKPVGVASRIKLAALALTEQIEEIMSKGISGFPKVDTVPEAITLMFASDDLYRRQGKESPYTKFLESWFKDWHLVNQFSKIDKERVIKAVPVYDEAIPIVD